MTHKRNTDGLSQSAQEKSDSAKERTLKAVSQMVKSGQTINFHTVAETAGVSIAYLYKHEDIKQRIDQLRKQQSSIKALPQKQGASGDSHKTINTTLKLRIKELNAEVRGLQRTQTLWSSPHLHALSRLSKIDWFKGLTIMSEFFLGTTQPH